MTRIDVDLDRIKGTVDLAAIVRECGVDLRRLGQDLVGRCPLHGEDKKPSLHVTPVKGLWHCFGHDKGGDAITWLQQREGLSFSQEKRRLLDRCVFHFDTGGSLESSAASFF